MKSSKFHIGIQIRFISSSFPKKGKWVMFHRGAETLEEAHGIIEDFKKNMVRISWELKSMSSKRSSDQEGESNLSLLF